MHIFRKGRRGPGASAITCSTNVPSAIETERDWNRYPIATHEAAQERFPMDGWGEVDDLAYPSIGTSLSEQATHFNGGEHRLQGERR